jgi:hypothetical protein
MEKYAIRRVERSGLSTSSTREEEVGRLMGGIVLINASRSGFETWAG